MSIVGSLSLFGVRKPFYGLWLALIISFCFVATFVLLADILPSVMQDELVYKDSLGFESIGESFYPNILYFWIFSWTQTFQVDMYLVVKVFNLIFHSLTSVVIYSFFRWRGHGWFAVVAGSVWQIGPFAIFSSFLLPESLYAFLIIFAVVCLLKALAEAEFRLLRFSATGVLIALAQMVKPHALFVAFAVVIVLLVSHFLWEKASVMKALGVVLAGFLLTRLIVGGLLAGRAGLDLFGGYLDVSRIASESSNSGPSTLGLILTEEFLVLLAFELLSTLVIVLFLAFPLVIVWVKFPIRSFPGSLQIAVIVVVVGTFIAFFEAFLTLTGDDHVNRALLRHYEFLVPVLLLTGMSELIFVRKDRWHSGFGNSLSVFLIFILYFAFVSTEGNAFLDASRYSDSSFTAALRDPRLFWCFVILQLAFAVGLLWLKGRATGFLTLMVSLALVGVFVASVSIARIENATPFESDLVAIEVKRGFSSIPGERILVLGDSQLLTQAAVFQMHKRFVDYRILGPGSRFTLDKDASLEYDLVAVLGSITLSHPGSIVYENEGGKLISLLD